MSFLENAKAKLTDAVGKHGDKISSGIDKAAAFADEKTGGKHSSKIDGAVGKAREGLDKFDSKGDGDLGNSDQPNQP